MANINKIKAGVSNPDALMFDKYKAPMANNGLVLTSLVPKDTTNRWGTQDEGEWEINDGWEVEFIDLKTIKINKFKIDTWGIRHHANSSTAAWTKYSNIKCEIKGLNYVNNNVIQATADSDEITGFIPAYCGSGGYIIEWYPGQFTDGSAVKGLVIQGFGCYGDTRNDARDLSYAMGRAPWEVNNNRDQMIADGTRISGVMYGGGCTGLCIGLFGGCQTATAKYDESAGAYKQYDISDNPIYIYLDIPDTSGEIDVTSVECWDAYAGEDQVYHKDKTLGNCWKKYGFAFPTGWNITKTNFNTNKYIEWISPTKFKIKGIPEGGVTITTTTTTDANYVNINWKQFIAKLSQGLPANASVKIVRAFTNAWYDYDEDTHTWSNPVEDIETVLSVGDNTIAAFSDEIHKKDTDENMTYSECKIVITSDTPVYELNCKVEIVTTFTDGEVLTITENKWGLSKVKVPTITDLTEHISKLTFNINPANADFWEPIKAYYASNVFTGDTTHKKFYNAKNLDELAIILPNDNWLYYDTTFKFASIKKLTFTGQENTNITSLNGIFEGLSNLKEFIVNVDEAHDGDYIAGCNDCSNMFNGCGLATYPSNFICWNAFRSNAQYYSRKATHAMSMFWYSAIETVPNYGTDADADANTILCGSASGIFYNCNKLVTVGPILDLLLVDPKDAEDIFINCTALTTIRIRNLNHGDWRFDNVAFEGTKKHGTLAALNAASIQYLFANLRDLNLYDANKNTETISNSFSKWSSNYFRSGIFESAYDFKFNSMLEFVAKLRTANQANAPFIVHTTATGIAMTFQVSGLAEGDSLIFGAAGSVEPDLTITTDGQYTINKNDTIDKGFELIGNSSIENVVTVVVDSGWDLSIPKVQSANLYCPAEWETNITDEMVTAANAKNWSIYIDGTLKSV